MALGDGAELLATDVARRFLCAHQREDHPRKRDHEHHE